MVRDHRKSRDECIGHILHGDVQQILENRNSILMDQILEPEKDNLKLVLLEGAPGIGKSTLAWELCRKWDEFSCMAKYKLVILLRLREQSVQMISDLSQLFFSYEGKDKSSLQEEVFKSQGNGLLFILDGFDELPKTLQKEGYLLNLIRGTVLPESTVLVTSRPSATAKLLTTCYPQKRIEILGFTQESVEAYATSVFSSEPEMLKNFKTYISASNNPAINSLMYIPLNAAIIVEIYRNCKSNTILPHTLTELYTQLCLTILNRFFNNDPSVGAFEDLPHDLYQQFLVLSKIAFEGMENEEIIFQALFPEVIHFGFLDAVSALYGGGSVSYNFLHLTLQEFFAAYHIAHLGCEGKELFQQYASNARWNVVWQFVAGLTHFEHYKGLIESERNFVDSIADETVISKQFMRCLFESQNSLNFLDTCKKITFTPFNMLFNPPCASLLDLDLYILGYCIANFFPSIGWIVQISNSYRILRKNPFRYFVCGLRTKIPCAGFIEILEVSKWLTVDLAELDAFFLHSVTSIIFNQCGITSYDLMHFSDLIPCLPSLKKLSFCSVTLMYDDLLMLLQQLSQSNVTDLDITGFSNKDVKLELPSSGRLEKLSIGNLPISNKLILSIPEHSSLKALCLYNTDISQLNLETNTTLIHLKIVNDLKLINYIEDVVKILNHNMTLQSMELMPFSILPDKRAYTDDYDAVKTIITALQSNGTVQRLVLHHIPSPILLSFVSPYEYARFCHPTLPHDTRIVWRQFNFS